MADGDPFEYIPNSRSAKIRCVVCGTKGYGLTNPQPGQVAGWQKKCLKGHPYVCACGRKFSSGQAIHQHLRVDRKQPGCSLFVPQIDVWKKWVGV